MKIRSLTILACLLVASCSGPEAAKDAANENTKARNSAVTKSSNSKLSKPESIAVKPPSSSEQYLAIKERFDNSVSDYRVAYEKATTEERNKLRQDHVPQAADYAIDFLAIAENYPEDSVAFDSLYWVARNVGNGEMADRACELLLTKHIDNEKLKDVFLGLAKPGPIVESRLDQLINKSPHDSVKAHATYALARYYSRLEKTKQLIANQPVDHGYDEATINYLESYNPDEAAVESLYYSLINNYADLKPNDRSRKTYKSLAEGALFELANLAIGKIAPDIEGEDMDGESFALSEYRGKVVMLDFWGDW